MSSITIIFGKTGSSVTEAITLSATLKLCRLAGNLKSSKSGRHLLGCLFRDYKVEHVLKEKFDHFKLFDKVFTIDNPKGKDVMVWSHKDKEGIIDSIFIGVEQDKKKDPKESCFGCGKKSLEQGDMASYMFVGKSSRIRERCVVCDECLEEGRTLDKILQDAGCVECGKQAKKEFIFSFLHPDSVIRMFTIYCSEKCHVEPKRTEGPDEFDLERKKQPTDMILKFGGSEEETVVLKVARIVYDYSINTKSQAGSKIVLGKIFKDYLIERILKKKLDYFQIVGNSNIFNIVNPEGKPVVIWTCNDENNLPVSVIIGVETKK